MVVKILKHEFSNFWWGFKVAKLLAWPGYLLNTLYTKYKQIASKVKGLLDYLNKS